MIFPILAGLINPLRAPFTFFLLFLNIFVFAATYDSFSLADEKIDEILRDDQFLETQGMAFAKMMNQSDKTEGPFSNARPSAIIKTMSEQALDGDKGARKLLGSLAMRNSVFMANAETFIVGKGDGVALQLWSEKFHELKRLQSEHPSYTWGVSHTRNDWYQWITYQFSHSGFSHLFWNMVFLLIFGCFVETELGGSFVMIGYVGGGMLGALAFSHLSGISASPLVGASAAVSGLIGLVAFAWMKKGPLKFFYWLLPLKGYFGFIMLPSWLVFVVTIIPDLSGYLSTAPDLGSVAYAAHIGGALWGGVLALSVRAGIMRSEVEETPRSPDLHNAA